MIVKTVNADAFKRIDEFLENFPTVSREQVIKLLTCASLRVLEGVATP